MFRIYADLTKIGIVIFVVLAGISGYALSFTSEGQFNWQHFLYFLGGLYFLSSGSLILNQVQEYKKDQLMPRTAKRPIASGKIKPLAAAILAVAFLSVGSDLLFKTSFISGLLGLVTVVLYNFIYVYWWKPKWTFAAIPGAVPGALPVTIGYAANSENIFSSDSIYLFLILFTWQMPHFWALAMRFRDDYAKASFPSLPNIIGHQKTFFHIGLWTIAYVGVAILAPLFVHSSWVYLAITLPLSVKLLQEFYKYQKSNGEKNWLSFFLWINLSVLVFLFTPIFDKWNFLILNYF